MFFCFWEFGKSNLIWKVKSVTVSFLKSFDIKRILQLLSILMSPMKLEIYEWNIENWENQFIISLH